MKKSLIYTIEREFLGSVSTTTFLVRMVQKHLQSEMERGEISCEKEMEKITESINMNIRIVANG